MQALDDPDAANLPEKLPGLPGSIEPVTVVEQRDRRTDMSILLASGVSTDHVMAAFAKKFQMSEQSIRNLMTEVRAMWDDDDADHARYERTGQKRRLLGHIRGAVADKKWTAVANLESAYSDVAGTNVHEDEKPVDVDKRLSDALLAVLNQKDTKDVRILIERERMFVELGQCDGTEAISKKLKAGKTIVEAPVE